MPVTFTARRTSRSAGADRALDRAAADFERLRPRLIAIAHRIVGRRVDAEDVVQDAWLRWQTCDRTHVLSPTAFLVTTTTRLAINATQSARARRECYVRRSSFQPVDGRDGPAASAERSAELELGLQVLLRRLAPNERAAYVLRHAFGYPYDRIAGLLQTTEVNARQLVSRASRRVTTDSHGSASESEQRHLLPAFVSASCGGDVTALEDLFATHVRRPHVPVRSHDGAPRPASRRSCAATRQDGGEVAHEGRPGRALQDRDDEAGSLAPIDSAFELDDPAPVGVAM
jgi:RNA polymerase sigma factor (sigma-70 family)